MKLYGLCYQILRISMKVEKYILFSFLYIPHVMCEATKIEWRAK